MITRKLFYILIAVLSVLTAIICNSANKIYNNEGNGWKQYGDLNSQRSKWNDYPHLQYLDNEALYNDVGWDDAVFNLAERYCGLDQNQTYEAYKVLNDAKTPHNNFWDDVLSAFYDVFSYRTQILLLALCLSWAVKIALGMCKSGDGKVESILDLFFGFSVLGVLFMLLLYFSYLQRIPSRIVWFTTVLCITPAYLTLLNLNWNNRETTCRISFNLSQLLAVIIVFLIIQNTIVFLHGHFRKWDLYLKKDEPVYQYVLEHPDDFFIYDSPTCMLSNPYRPYKAPVTNASYWGGWLWGSPLQRKIIELNGMDYCYFDTMLEANKFFIVSDENAELILEYYDARYDDIQCEVVYKNTSYTVYSYRRKSL